MKKKILFRIIILLSFTSINLKAQNIEKVKFGNKKNEYYLAVKPEGKIKSVLILLPGFGQKAESIFPETKLHNVGYKNNTLTIGIAYGKKLYTDNITIVRLSKIIENVIEKFNVNKEIFVFGGFSAGGTVALRYVELCKELPNEYPINPKGVFMVDSPIDIFTIWNTLEKNLEDAQNETAIKEAKWAMNLIEKDHGIPRENIETYQKMNPFSMNKKFGENEKWLIKTPVRAYHDISVNWRIINRKQPVSRQNFLVTSELIYRLLINGNKQAEFMESFETGYRSNGERHPHSWSIVNEEECIKWINKITE